MLGLMLRSVDYQVLRMTARFFSLLWIRLRDRLRKRRLEEGIERRHKALVSVSAEARLDLRIAMGFVLPTGPFRRRPRFEAAWIDVGCGVATRFGERGEAARRDRLDQ